MNERNFKYDNMRFFLMLLVICGHFMELFDGGAIIYKIIYSFHMPAFLFLSGRFARFDLRKILKHFLFPYFVFQTLYLVFQAVVINGTQIVLQYLVPYWILWYLFALMVYYALIPILPEKQFKNALWVITISVCVSLTAGYINFIGYELSLSRILVFSPFFMFGYYYSCIKDHVQKWFSTKFLKTRLLVLSGCVILLGTLYIIRNVPNTLLYGSYSYAASACSILDRLILLCVASAWITLLNILLNHKKIRFVTLFGQNTMPIFLFHAFFVQLAGKYGIFQYSAPLNFALMGILSLAIITILGNPTVGKLYKKVF